VGAQPCPTAELTALACVRCSTEIILGASPGGLCPACLLTTALASDPDIDESGDVSSTLAPGTMVGLFQIVGVLGRGGMATVYEAYDRRLDRAVALKVLPPEFLHDGTFARRFENEARVIAKLEHPNIVPIYASGIDEGMPWMGMRLLAGGNMGALLENGRPALPQAVQMLRDVADALDYAHARGVVHRDVKPTNILRDGSGRMCVGDFGLAQMLEGGPGLTRTGTLVGTPQYMAPEQALGSAADHRCDIYSLGVVAYEIFVGDVPFKGDSPVAVLLKHVNEPVPTPRDGQVPPLLMRAILKALAKDPGDRWPSAGAFVAALEAAAGTTSGDSPPHDVRAAERSRRSGIGRMTAAGGALLAAAGLAWFVAQEPLPPQSPPPPAADRTLDIALPAAFAPAPPATSAPAPAPATPPNRAGPRPAAVETKPPQETPATGIEASPLVVIPVRIGLPQTPVPQPRTPADAPAAGGAEPPAVGVASSQPPVADVVTPPIRIRTVSPEYPTVARAAALEGDVIVQAVVGADGKVRDVQVLQGVHPVLDDAARKAVLRYEYTPGRRNGIPESAVIRVTVSFRLR
jgi:TonB family protein